MSDLLIRNARPMGGDPADILIRDGRIEAIGKGLSAPGVRVEEAGGRIALPGLVDAHTHLDKTLMGLPWYRNEGSTDLQAMIANEREVRRARAIDFHIQSMRHALALVANGATLIRSHVDVDTDHGLAMMQGVLRTRDALRDVVEIEIVAFPQSGLLVRPGTLDLMEEALRQGADLVGGLDPAGIDRDPKGHLDAVFDLALRHDRAVDIHLHEPGELGAFSTELILERTRAAGMQGRVTLSHAFCLGMPDRTRAGRLVEQIAELDVAIMTVGSPSREVPAVKELRAAGVRMGGGSDGVQDSWSPLARPDPLDRARIIALKNNLRGDADTEQALDLCGAGGAEAMGRPRPALAPGHPGDVVLVEGEAVAHAVVMAAPRTLVVKAGRVTARNGIAEIAAP